MKAKLMIVLAIIGWFSIALVLSFMASEHLDTEHLRDTGIRYRNVSFIMFGLPFVVPLGWGIASLVLRVVRHRRMTR